jgi:hypothetical protein
VREDAGARLLIKPVSLLYDAFGAWGAPMRLPMHSRYGDVSRHTVDSKPFTPSRVFYEVNCVRHRAQRTLKCPRERVGERQQRARPNQSPMRSHPGLCRYSRSDLMAKTRGMLGPRYVSRMTVELCNRCGKQAIVVRRKNGCKKIYYDKLSRMTNQITVPHGASKNEIPMGLLQKLRSNFGLVGRRSILDRR